MSDPLLPRALERVGVPPIKCQGIKTKLVRQILTSLAWSGSGRWVEPFVGSGVVAFNLAPPRALLTDTNPHIIRLYRAIQAGSVDGPRLATFFRRESERLRRGGADYYYEVRERFNAKRSPLDFLFLNRSCFNGVMRFNRAGAFNVPFCQKPERFRPAYVTKIVNQVEWLKRQMEGRAWVFKTANWTRTLAECSAHDFVYADPPYVGRHAGYFSSWGIEDAEHLAQVCRQLPCGFAVSMWSENRFRRNDHLAASWDGLEMRLFDHFYHVGSTQPRRNKMEEALIVRAGFARAS